MLGSSVSGSWSGSGQQTQEDVNQTFGLAHGVRLGRVLAEVAHELVSWPGADLTSYFEAARAAVTFDSRCPLGAQCPARLTVRMRLLC